MSSTQEVKQIAAYLGMGLLSVGSWTYTTWLKDVSADTPYFGAMLALSGPTLMSFSVHGSFGLWVIGIAIVLAPVCVAIRKDSVSWRTAAWSAGLWLFECIAFGGPFLFRL
jgi:hypothetical protein